MASLILVMIPCSRLTLPGERSWWTAAWLPAEWNYLLKSFARQDSFGVAKKNCCHALGLSEIPVRSASTFMSLLCCLHAWSAPVDTNSEKYRLLMFLILVTSHMLCSIQLLKKRFQVKMFGLFLSYCILFVLDHILSYCIRFLDLENAKKLRYCHISGKKQSLFWKSKMAAIGCLEKM